MIADNIQLESKLLYSYIHSLTHSDVVKQDIPDTEGISCTCYLIWSNPHLLL